MNPDDLRRYPVGHDEFFGELADTLDLVEAMTRDRLGGGELDRRREVIMGRFPGPPGTLAAFDPGARPGAGPASHNGAGPLPPGVIKVGEFRGGPADHPLNLPDDVAGVPRRSLGRRLYSLAAAIVVFAALSVGALATGGHWFTPASPTTEGPDHASEQDPLPNASTDVGSPSKHYAGTSPRTGVSLEVDLVAKDFGTQITVEVASLTGPATCTLAVVLTDGSSATVTSWMVSAKGWGTAANAQPLRLQAITAIPRAQIAYLQIKKTSTDGSGETLVQVP
jgi:hypothetical protein